MQEPQSPLVTLAEITRSLLDELERSEHVTEIERGDALRRELDRILAGGAHLVFDVAAHSPSVVWAENETGCMDRTDPLALNDRKRDAEIEDAEHRGADATWALVGKALRLPSRNSDGSPIRYGNGDILAAVDGASRAALSLATLRTRCERLIVIESPFAGDVEANVAYARRALRHSLDLGEVPFASHLTYPGALDDANPDERAQGIEAGFAWASMAPRAAVYTDLGISPGMTAAIERHVREGRALEFRKLD